MTYTPDNWVILKLPTLKDEYKVLAGWSGGYLEGDMWRFNSGISKIDEKEDYYNIHGYSGSVYKCYKCSETIRMNIQGMLSSLLNAGCELVDIKDILPFREKEKETKND